MLNEPQHLAKIETPKLFLIANKGVPNLLERKLKNNQLNRRENKSSTTVYVDSKHVNFAANGQRLCVTDPSTSFCCNCAHSVWQWQPAELHFRTSERKIGSVPEEKREAAHQNVWTRKRRLKRVWHCQILCQRLESKFRRSDDSSYRPSYLWPFNESSRTVCLTIIKSSGRLETCRSTIRRLWFRSMCLNWQRFLLVFLHWRHETGGSRICGDDDESWMGVI